MSKNWQKLVNPVTELLQTADGANAWEQITLASSSLVARLAAQSEINSELMNAPVMHEARERLATALKVAITLVPALSALAKNEVHLAIDIEMLRVHMDLTQSRP